MILVEGNVYEIVGTDGRVTRFTKGCVCKCASATTGKLTTRGDDVGDQVVWTFTQYPPDQPVCDMCNTPWARTAGTPATTEGAP